MAHHSLRSFDSVELSQPLEFPPPPPDEETIASSVGLHTQYKLPCSADRAGPIIASFTQTVLQSAYSLESPILYDGEVFTISGADRTILYTVYSLLAWEIEGRKPKIAWARISDSGSMELCADYFSRLLTVLTLGGNRSFQYKKGSKNYLVNLVEPMSEQDLTENKTYQLFALKAVWEFADVGTYRLLPTLEAMQFEIAYAKGLTQFTVTAPDGVRYSVDLTNSMRTNLSTNSIQLLRRRALG